MARDWPVAAREESFGASPDDGVARGCGCDPVHGADGLSVADAAEGLSAAQHGSGIFLRVARGWDVARDQSAPAHGAANGGRTRRQPVRRRDRQPVGEDPGQAAVRVGSMRAS